MQMIAAVGLTRELDERGDLSLGLRFGVVVDGYLRQGGSELDFDPGFVAGLHVDWRALSAPDDPITLTLGVQLAVAHATLTLDGVSYGWTATDVRASVTVSRTLWDRLTPYLSVRAFGGPIFFRDATGADKTHVQIALGLALQIASGVSLSVEGAVLAERGVFGGVAVAF